MLKFNLANLNGRFRTVQEQEDGRAENNMNTIVPEPGKQEEATAQAQALFRCLATRCASTCRKAFHS